MAHQFLENIFKNMRKWFTQLHPLWFRQLYYYYYIINYIIKFFGNIDN